MNSANDNKTLAARNSTHSLVLTTLGGECVLSCFALGADGEPDMDREIFVRSVTPAAAKARFQQFADLLSCTAAEFDAQMDWTLHAIASLSSCLNREVIREADTLRDAMTGLRLASLKRRHALREQTRLNVLARGESLLAQRFSNLEAKIEREAEWMAARAGATGRAKVLRTLSKQLAGA